MAVTLLFRRIVRCKPNKLLENSWSKEHRAHDIVGETLDDIK